MHPRDSEHMAEWLAVPPPAPLLLNNRGTLKKHKPTYVTLPMAFCVTG